MDTWTLETQKATQRTASNHGETWTSKELEFVSAFNDEPIAEVAEALGRTYFAVTTMRAMIAAGKATPAPVARQRRGGAVRQWMIGDPED